MSLETEEPQVVSVGGDGQQTAITDTAELAEIQESQERMADHVGKRVASKDRIAQLLRPSAKIIVVMEEINVAGETMIFPIRQHSPREISRIDNKKYRRKANGQLEFSNDYAETVGAAWQIHECVMRDANEGKTGEDGKPLSPDWVRMFTLEEVLGTGKEDDEDVNSILGNPETEAGQFYFELQAAVWRVNPTLNPLYQQEAKEQLGMK